MLFRLTFLLAGIVGLAMVFAPDLPDDSRAALAQSEADLRAPPPPPPPAAVPAPPSAAAEREERAAAPPPSASSPAVPLAEDAPPAAPAPAPPPQVETAETLGTEDDAAEPPPLVIEGLTGGDSAAALSLSERIRERIEAERAALDEAETAPAEAAPAAPLIPGGAPLSPVQPGPGERRAQVVATSVNLRGGPSTANPVVGRVDFGDEVVLLGEATPGWSRIRHPETGANAFMASRFLQPLEN